VRETREEIGVTMAPADARFIHVHNHRTATGATRLTLLFEATAWTGEPHNAEPAMCDAFGLFPPAQTSSPMVPYIAECLRSYLSGEPFAVTGWSADGRRGDRRIRASSGDSDAKTAGSSTVSSIYLSNTKSRKQSSTTEH
jgi:hypothetical protein